jgi:hypothetical protein
MSRKTHPTSVSQQGNVASEADEALWAFFPILISAAAICLLIFVFMLPSFEADEAVRATSARSAAETVVTEQQNETTTEGLKDKPLESR